MYFLPFHAVPISLLLTLSFYVQIILFFHYDFYHLLPILELIKKLEFLHVLKDVFEHKITSVLFILDYLPIIKNSVFMFFTLSFMFFYIQ